MIAPSSFDGFFSAGDVLAGRYEIRGEIGRGGYSVVYRAHDRDLDTTVAVKLLVPPPAVAHVARERMRREVRAVRGLSHAHIVAVHDYLVEGPWSFIVMEFVDGQDLSVRLAEHGPLSIDDTARIGLHIAEALSAAHRRGILHRDVKPPNILVDAHGNGRLTDFGSARLDGQISMTQTGGLVGTLHYAAPEVVAGDRGDARSDVYALGMTLYFALTDRLPDSRSPHLPPTPRHDGFHPRERRADVPEWLDRVIARATAGSPSSRFPSAALFADALRAGHDDDAPAASTSVMLIDSCLICGMPEPLGLGVCAACGGSDATADVFVFIEAPRRRADRREVIERLEHLLSGRVSSSDLAEVLRGHRPLVRLPSAAAERFVTQLGLRSVPARAVPAHRTWERLPVTFYGLLGAVLAVGLAAGVAAQSWLLWITPVVAGLMLTAAWQRAARPVLASAQRVLRLPAGAQDKVIATLAKLPPGSAKSLLGDLVRLAHGVYLVAARHDMEDEFTGPIVSILDAAVDAADDLAALDTNLAVLTNRRSEWTNPSTEWIDTLSRTEQLRDRMVQHFLDGIALLGRVQSEAIESTEAAGRQVREVADDLARDFRVHVEARREVERLLAAGEGAEAEPTW